MNAIHRYWYGAAAMLAISLVAASLSRGADYTWSGGGNIWSNAGNWTPGGGPPKMAGDTATLGAMPPNVISIDIVVNLNKFTLNSAGKQLDATNRSMSASNGFDIHAGRLSITNS